MLKYRHVGDNSISVLAPTSQGKMRFDPDVSMLDELVRDQPPLTNANSGSHLDQDIRYWWKKILTY